MKPPAVQTCLWFRDSALEAARTYVALVPDSEITHVFPNRANPAEAMVVHLALAGQHYSFLNGGPMYPQTPAASIEVHLDTQAEVDRLWDALMQGGKAMRCGWLTDRFGVTWQIVPRVLIEVFRSGDDAMVQRMTQVMMSMVKLDGPSLEAAAKG